MSKTIILPSTSILQRRGNIIYQIGKVGDELDLKINATHPHEADFVGLSIVIHYIERLINYHENTELPEDTEKDVLEAHAAALAQLKEQYLMLKAHQQIASQVVMNLF